MKRAGSKHALAIAVLLELEGRAGVGRLLDSGASPTRMLLRRSPVAGRVKMLGLEEALLSCGATVIAWDESGFPRRLREIPDPPRVLYLKGDPGVLNQPGIAIVGARRASRFGLEVARTLARTLSECGALIVSGLALGIDAAAHTGACDGSGRTLAVLGSGLSRVQPRSNLGLSRRITDQGGLMVSEYPPMTPADRFRFPERNRLISALSEGVVVVEATSRSGSLITARLALEQGREVMAVPGLPGMPGSAGCHTLLKQGAGLVECAQDVVDVLGHRMEDVFVDRPRGERSHGDMEWMPENQRRVLQALGGLPMTAEEIGDVLGLSTRDCLVVVSELELGGFVQRVADGYIRTPTNT